MVHQVHRPLRSLALAAAIPLGLLGLSACDPPAIVTFTVTSGTDAVDVAIGDGVCAAAGGQCTLRAAIQEGNAETDPGVVEVIVAADQVFVGGTPGEDASVSGDLDLLRPFRIVSESGVEQILAAAGGDRIFDVFAGADFVVRNLLVRNLPVLAEAEGGIIRSQGALVTVDRSELDGGRVQSLGGTIKSDRNVTLIDSTLRNGRVVAGSGGALAAPSVAMVRSGIHGTDAVDSSAIVLLDGEASSTILSSTIWGTTSDASTVVSFGPLTIQDSTIAYNTAPFGVLAGAISIGNSVLTNSFGGSVPTDPNCFNAPTSLGNNAEDGTTCGFSGAGDVSNAAINLQNQEMVGRVRVYVFEAGPMIDSGGNCLPIDIHGRPRAVDSDGVGGAQCERGAYENDLTPMELNVNTGTDGVDANLGDGLCRTAGGLCTLRAAIQETNLWPGSDLITMGSAPSVVLSVAGTNEDAAARGDLDITGNLRIWFNLFGSGSSTVDGAALDRVFDVHSGTVVLERIVVTDGLESGSGGAGIRTAAGSHVTLLESRVTANLVALATAGGGGGIRAAGTLVVERSTIDANRAGTGGGGGILALGSTTVANSTITANIAPSGSGFRANSAATVTLTDSTVSHNTSGSGIHRAGVVNVQNSIVANHTVGGNCSSALTSLGHNLDSVASCGFTGTGDAQNADPLLGALQDNGGPTHTRKPGVGSPAINTGTCLSSQDQRLTSRPLGGACDKGAVEQV